MKTHRFLKGRVMALLLALCMVATLLPVTAFAAGTPITKVELTNDYILFDKITADMKINWDRQGAFTTTEGCRYVGSE